MSTAFEKMMGGLDEVEAYLSGETKGFKVHVPGEVDVKAIRNRLGLTQARFSDAFGFSLDAIKNWESRRRRPEAAARVLLTVIEQDPVAVVAALHPDVVKIASAQKKTRVKSYSQAKRYIVRAASKSRKTQRTLRASA
jgi:putative transcriptional regulator